MNEQQWQWLEQVLGVRRPDTSAPDEDEIPWPRLPQAELDEGGAPIDTARFDATPLTGVGATLPGGSSPSPAPSPAPAPAPTTPDPARQAVTQRLSAIVKRFNTLPDPRRTADMVAATQRFLSEYQACKAMYDQGKYTEATPFLDPMEAAVKTLEDLQADLPKQIQAAQTQADQVKKLKDEDLAKLKPSETAAMVRQLLAAGKPSGEVRAAQIRLYNAATLDPAFMKADRERGKEIAAQLKGDAELKSARKDWKKTSEEDKIKALRKVVAAQSKCLGIPPPELVIEHIAPADGLVTNGYFSPADGKLHINMDPASSVQNFERAVDLAIHENAHNWQAHLVRQLKAGELKPGDTAYEQAQLFAVNEIHPGGYVTGSEDYAAYKKQPLEDHAWTTGPDTAKQIIKGL